MNRKILADGAEVVTEADYIEKANGRRSNALAVVLALVSVVLLGALTFGIYRYTIESSRPEVEKMPAMADEAESSGNILLGLALRKQYCEKFPTDIKALLLYAAALARNNDFESANKEIEKLGKSSDIGSLLLVEANKFYDKSDFAVASFLYARYINKFDSTNTSAIIDCGYALFHSGRRQEGKEMTKRALNISRDQPIALFNLGVMAAEENNMTESREMFEKCAISAERQYPELSAKAKEILKRIDNIK